MKTAIILAVYLAVFLIDFMIDWVLDILNINASLKNQDRIPEAFRSLIEEAAYRRSVDYTLRKGRFGLLHSLIGRGVLILMLITGAAGILDGFIAVWNLPAYWHSLIFLVIITAALSIAEMPASLYSRFVIEEEFGFNTLTLRTLIGDAARQILVGLPLMALMLGGLYAAMRWADNWWWLAAWVFWSVFQLLMVVLYPMLIAPLFNKFEALPEGRLNDRLAALAERSGFANRGIYVMDGSRRSRHSNAYFTGLGRFRRIVIYDTLIEALGEEELEAVLAHEIGHWKFGHIRKRLILSFAVSLALFALCGLMISWEPLYRAFGLGTPSLHGLLFWLSYFSSPLSSLLTPLGNRRSRKHEYQADRYAAEATGGPDPMKGALLNLGRDNLSNLTPHPAYSFWHYSHPVLSERLAALDDIPSPDPQA